MTLSPPNFPRDPPVQTPQSATAILDAAQKPAQWLDDGARIAILCPIAQVVYATSAALALFDVKDLGELESRLVIGEGPSARRLRHLAATQPIGDPMRLERLRFSVGRRPTSLNLRSARIATPEGAIFLLLSAGAAGRDAVQAAQSAPPECAETSRKSRFLWTLDSEGRFGDPHPILVATVGDHAPQRGETLDAWGRRAGVEGGDALARVMAQRATFSDLTVAWPVAGGDRRLQISLSAAPAFDRNRGFAGYRGFGVIGEAIEAATAPPFAAPSFAGAAAETSPLQEEAIALAPDATGVGGDARGQGEADAESASLSVDVPQASTDPAPTEPAHFGVSPHGEPPTEGASGDDADATAAPGRIERCRRRARAGRSRTASRARTASRERRGRRRRPSRAAA